MNDDSIKINERKKILLAAVGKVIQRERRKRNKGINKFSFEYDIGNGLLSRLERGDTDTQISTMWKLANAFELKFTELAELIEKELPKDFNFYD